ncbi:hypothetical protein AB0M43_38285 [Longispora sp. NPDC051575]|uniref:hypothetical protein n=1 Tax=Longispora sp. NPDC051575 TaxID=3154943 RepID=UPI0034494B23
MSDIENGNPPAETGDVKPLCKFAQLDLCDRPVAPRAGATAGRAPSYCERTDHNAQAFHAAKTRRTPEGALLVDTGKLPAKPVTAAGKTARDALEQVREIVAGLQTTIGVVLVDQLGLIVRAAEKSADLDNVEAELEAVDAETGKAVSDARNEAVLAKQARKKAEDALAEALKDRAEASELADEMSDQVLLTQGERNAALEERDTARLALTEAEAKVQAGDKRATDLETRLAEAGETIRERGARVEELERQLATAQEAAAAAAIEIDALTVHVDAAAVATRELTGERDAARAELATVTAERDRQADALAAADRRAGKLEEHLADARATADRTAGQLTAAEERAMALTTQLTEATDARTAAEKTARTQAGELITLHAKVEAQDTAAKTAAEQLAEVRADLKRERADHKAELERERTERAEELKRDRAQHKTELDHERQATAAATKQAAELTEKLTDLATTLASQAPAKDGKK